MKKIFKFLHTKILSNSNKNPNAAHLLAIFFVYLIGTSTYYILLFSTFYLAVRFGFTLAIIIAFVLLERSPLSADTLSYLTPSVMGLTMVALAVFFDGDFLLYVYAMGGAMISLTYMKPRGVIIYSVVMVVVMGVLLLGFNMNLLGPRFTMAQNYAGLVTATGLNICIYFFCAAYSRLAKAKSAFLSNMSHEIRTPITTVLGISEIELQDKSMPPEKEQAFTRIHSSAKLLLGIINDILDFTKMEDGKMDILNEQYFTVDIINRVSQLHHLYLQEKDIQFNLHVSERMPIHLIGDALRIEQILLNLLSNAFKYTEKGTIELTFDCERQKSDRVFLLFSVSDTGMGMTKEQVELIYNEYARFHEREHTSISGTGLGMSIVQKFIILMNGQIKIESEVNKGTTVSVRLPQKILNLEVIGKKGIENIICTVNPDEQRDPDFTPEPMPYGSILVVDDIEANLYVIEGLLNFYSLNIETCLSGELALEKVRQGNEYDIIFMDSMMPGLSGTETLYKLRKRGYTKAVVVLTANALVGSKEEYISRGFDDFLSKPIITKDLHDVLIKYVKGSHAEEAAEVANSAGAFKPPPQGINNFIKSSKITNMLRSDFIRNQANVTEEITKAIENNDYKTAHRLAHTLKGLAAILNEKELTSAAQQAEIALEKEETPANMQSLKTELDKVLESFKTTINIAAPAPAESVDTKKLYAELKPLLELRKPDAIKHVPTLRSIPEAAILAYQIEELDLAAAEKNLDILMKMST